MQTEELTETPPARSDFLTVALVVVLVAAPVMVGTMLESHELPAMAGLILASLRLTAEWGWTFALAAVHVVGLR